jgi:2-C-methyl-D-erythritol 4-phosphate cytidylyltransferase/2-C-methyl-D-erythritol 2,4-cyclodiphosphate synthase
MRLTKISLVMLCAGSSSRFGHPTKKQWLRIKHAPLWLFVTQRLSSYYTFDKIIIVASNKEELRYMQNFCNEDEYTFVLGGDTRQASMQNALHEVSTSFVMISDVARACIPKQMITRLIENIHQADCIVPFLNVHDTVVYEQTTINRDDVKRIQTPQLSNTQKLKAALNEAKNDFTDDSSAIKAINGTVFYVKGDEKASKLTFNDDIHAIACLKKPAKVTFTGTGFDIHAFEEKKIMVLGGVTIDVPYGFKAHSDGDVLIHSLIDALLGACGAGDIGEFFPDTNMQYKDIDSKVLLKQIVSFIHNVGYIIVNVDVTIIAQQPKINPYKNVIKRSIAHLLHLEASCVNIKATTAEKLGFIGRKEGVAVQSSANLQYYNWKRK